MGSDSQMKVTRHLRLSLRVKACTSIVLSVICFIFYKKTLGDIYGPSSQIIASDRLEGNPVQVYLTNEKEKVNEEGGNSPQLDLTEFEHCSQTPTSPRKPKEQWSKPLWFGIVHNSFPDSIHKELIKQLTGLESGGKSFYASTKKLKHCIGETESATCSTGDGPNNKQRKQFNDKFMFVIRNPKTTFPVAHNYKAIMYHGQEGQVEIDNWREARDTWFNAMMDGWIATINDWKESDYEAGIYIVYEHLMDIRKGPKVVRRIGEVLKQAGFDVVVDDEQISCVWFNALGKERIEQYHKSQYDYDEYVPGFTQAQQQLILKALSTYLASVETSDEELASILKEYHNDIQNNMILDEKWANETVI